MESIKAFHSTTRHYRWDAKPQVESGRGFHITQENDGDLRVAVHQWNAMAGTKQADIVTLTYEEAGRLRNLITAALAEWDMRKVAGK